jgi:ATP-dependent DNA helicase HFM1/MER3
MKTFNATIRIIALSATVPNVHDVATWVGIGNTTKYPAPTLAAILHFGEEYRPVRLVRHVQSYPMGSCSPFLFDKKLDYKLSPSKSAS